MTCPLRRYGVAMKPLSNIHRRLWCSKLHMNISQPSSSAALDQGFRTSPQFLNSEPRELAIPSEHDADTQSRSSSLGADERQKTTVGSRVVWCAVGPFRSERELGQARSGPVSKRASCSCYDTTMSCRPRTNASVLPSRRKTGNSPLLRDSEGRAAAQ